MLDLTLTEIEVLGLRSDCNMADGHAYHELSQSQEKIIYDMPKLWLTSSKKKHKLAENDFKLAFSRLARCPSLKDDYNFRICPTASNSIDTVATWLHEKRLKTLLIEPTFDNLALILRRRKVEIESVAESEIGSIVSGQTKREFGAIFLVNPNNPTGTSLSEAQFKQIVDFCAKNKKVLLLDNTFRFFVAQDYDTYQILRESRVSYISIEDTGKVWPTQDMKASLLFFSEDTSAEINAIYEEIYLCVSNFQLEVLGSFLKDAAERGLESAVWCEVAERRKVFREAISNSVLSIHPSSEASKISVEWVKIKNGAGDDFALMQTLRNHGLVVLPGRHFYWNSHGPENSFDTLRFSLLKTKSQFRQSIETLRKALKELE